MIVRRAILLTGCVWGASWGSQVGEFKIKEKGGVWEPGCVSGARVWGSLGWWGQDLGSQGVGEAGFGEPGLGEPGLGSLR